MYKRLFFTVLIFLLNYSIQAQSGFTIQSKSDYVTYHLDLDAVLEIYNTSTDLSMFRTQINNPDDKISIIDLNNDGKPDNLEVIERKKKGIKYTIIQSEINNQKYEDVAIIHLARDPDTSHSFSRNTKVIDLTFTIVTCVALIVAGIYLDKLIPKN